jgi:hypothetical protein
MGDDPPGVGQVRVAGHEGNAAPAVLGEEGEPGGFTSGNWDDVGRVVVCTGETAMPAIVCRDGITGREAYLLVDKPPKAGSLSSLMKPHHVSGKWLIQP